MPYTVHDAPATVARIEADLDLVRATVQEADPRLRALVLTGGFARGEGAMLDGEPQNDYDLVALRGVGAPKVPYERLRSALEQRLGLHLDLAPVPVWRLPWVAPSIFWYETALRGRVLWGEASLLARIPIRAPHELEPTEGLRLLVNRAAGLLLVRGQGSAHDHRIQAAKGLLAALDVHLLAYGAYAPSQTERWAQLAQLHDAGNGPPGLRGREMWLQWAYRFKVDPGAAPETDPLDAWRAAARAILDAVGVGLRHARLPSLEAYARRDGLLDHAYYMLRSGRLPGANRFVAHPTGRLRVATLRLLAGAADGEVPPAEARRLLAPFGTVAGEPLHALEALRGSTLQ